MKEIFRIIFKTVLSIIFTIIFFIGVILLAPVGIVFMIVLMFVGLYEIIIWLFENDDKNKKV